MCVYPHRWSAHTDGGAFCVSKCVCVYGLVSACALKACVYILSVDLQMLARMHVGF